MKKKYETKFTIPLMISGVISVIIFFLGAAQIYQVGAFMITALLMCLNYKEAAKLDENNNYKWQFRFSFVMLILFGVAFFLELFNKFF